MSENTFLIASYDNTFDEAMVARSAHLSRSKTENTVLYMAIISLALVFIWIFVRGRFTVYEIILGVVFIAGIALITTVSQKYANKKAFYQSAAANKPVEYKISEDELISEITGVFVKRQQWSTFLLVKRTKDGLILYVSPQFYFWIPERAFRSEADADTAAEFARRSAQNYFEL